MTVHFMSLRPRLCVDNEHFPSPSIWGNTAGTFVPYIAPATQQQDYSLSLWKHRRWSIYFTKYHICQEVTDGLVVRASILVTWTVLSWSGGHEFEPRSGRTWGAWYFCPKLYLNQNSYQVPIYQYNSFWILSCLLTVTWSQYGHSVSCMTMSFSQVTDGRVVRAGVSVTWNVLSWSEGHEFEPQSGWTWGGSTSVLSRTWTKYIFPMLENHHTYIH